jgi:hypothetical protein
MLASGDIKNCEMGYEPVNPLPVYTKGFVYLFSIL